MITLNSLVMCKKKLNMAQLFIRSLINMSVSFAKDQDHVIKLRLAAVGNRIL